MRLDVLDELLVRIRQRDGVLAAARNIARRLLSDGVKRLDLAGFQFLIEDAVVETGRAFAGLHDALDDKEDRDDGEDDQEDRSEMLCHFNRCAFG